MPLLKLHTSAPIPADKRDGLARDLSAILSKAIGKPEQYVMVALAEGPICMGGELGPAAFADVRSIGGLSGSVNKEIAAQVCAKLEQTLDIPPGRTFLNFTDVARDCWGYNGATFG